MNSLLQPIQIGKKTMKNRIMFPPLTTTYEGKDGSITDQCIGFYERLAIGGVGYIVLGDVAPAMTLSPTPKLYSDDLIPGFKKLADAIHAHGALIGGQVFHPEYDPVEILAMMKSGDVAAIRKKLHDDMESYCNTISIDRIKEIQGLIVNSAVRLYKADFDVIEIHGDRLVGMFASPLMNKRVDEYGGSLENRAKFGLEIARQIRELCPDAAIEFKLALIRTNPSMGKGGPTLEEGLEIAKWLENIGVDTIHVCQANHTAISDTIPPMGIQPYQCFTELASEIKKVVNIPVSAVGKIINPKQAAAIIDSGKADIVAMGRPLLADPDWVKKIEAGKENEIRLCMMCNKGCTDALTSRGTVRCVLNAEHSYEYERSILPADKIKKVAVVGAGLAGLEAARVASIKGHDVTIYEKSMRIGGQINIASIPPRKDEMNRSVQYYENVLANSNITFKMNHAVTQEELIAENFDHAILAVGGQNMIIPVNGFDQAHVLDSWKVLSGTETCGGTIAVIGGGLVGSETAEYLAERKDCTVNVIEMADMIAKEESLSIRPTLMKTYDEYSVGQYVNHKLTEITKDSIICENKDGENVIIKADYVVMAVGAKPVVFQVDQLEQSNITFDFIGDCNQTCKDISKAINEAYLAANKL